MNTDELIERIHNENATLRRAEHCAFQRPAVRIVWRIAVPAAAAAAILLIVLLPREKSVEALSSRRAACAPAGIYCNSQCNPDDVLALIDNNINHIRTIQSL